MPPDRQTDRQPDPPHPPQAALTVEPHGRHQLVARGGVGRAGPEAEEEAELGDAEVGVLGQPLLLQVLQRHGGGTGPDGTRQRAAGTGQAAARPSDSAATGGNGGALPPHSAPCRAGGLRVLGGGGGRVRMRGAVQASLRGGRGGRGERGGRACAVRPIGMGARRL